MEELLPADRVGARRAAQVQGVDPGDLLMTPTTIDRTLGPVGLLGIQEEPLVEAADIGQGRSPDEQDRADDIGRAARQPSQADAPQPRPRGARKRPGHSRRGAGRVVLARRHARQGRVGR
ncbi:MAG: hypothetical protein V9G19_26855 [Tetrasphaera sp.]